MRVPLTCAESDPRSSDSDEGALLTVEEAWRRIESSSHDFRLSSQNLNSYSLNLSCFTCEVDLKGLTFCITPITPAL